MDNNNLVEIYRCNKAKEDMFNDIKEDLLTEPNTRKLVEVIKSFGIKEDTAVLILIELGNQEVEDDTLLAFM